jgi:hypothetical protein
VVRSLSGHAVECILIPIAEGTKILCALQRDEKTLFILHSLVTAQGLSMRPYMGDTIC